MTQSSSRRSIARHAPLIVVIGGVILYSIIYSYITVSKYLAYNATILDLGVNANLIYGVFHGNISFIPGTPYFINTGKMIYLVLAPFYNLYPHEQLLLVFQSFWIALGAIPLYYLTRKKYGDGFVPVAIALSWLLYYPMAGVNWFDFHLMALFPTFFLIGIAALESGKKRLAFISLLLATVTDFLVPLIMILYCILLFYRNYKNETIFEWKSYAVVLVVFSAGILLITNIIFGVGYTASYAYNTATQVAVFKAGYSYISLYFVRILIPVAFVAILSPEFLTLLLPFLALTSFSQYRPYTDTMFIQYPALTAPIVFIATVEALHKLSFPSRNFKLTFSVKKIATAILLLNVVFALIFSPAGNIISNSIYSSQYGQLITGNSGIYHTGSQISQQSYDHSIREMISLVPNGSSILAQNNLPELAQTHVIVMPSQILLNNSITGYPEYVLVDPYNSYFTDPVLPGEPHNITAMNAFNKLYGTGLYGIKAESDGIILLKLNYSGQPVIYNPIHKNYTLPQLRIPSGVSMSSNSSGYYLGNLTGGTAWYGPYITLPPGVYYLNIALQSYDVTSNDSLFFQVSSFIANSNNTTILHESLINASTFGKSDRATLNFELNIHSYNIHVEFRGVDATWHSPLSLSYLSIQQISML